MSNFGQSIRIYLADGIITGIRWAEIINWTGQAVACPRIRISELAQWPEVDRPGVYFLLQGGLGADKDQVYVGESENIRKRLAQQVQERDFWTEAIAFTNKDDNLTKAHVRYLESRLIALAKTANRYEVLNGNNGTLEPMLPRADKAAMESFLDNLRVVLSSLGHRLLEPVATGTNLNAAATESVGTVPIISPLATTLLHFATAGIKASGYVTDEGFTLSANSQVRFEHTPATSKNVVALRSAAIEKGQLILVNGNYQLVADMAFPSSSAAVCFVAGNSSSGPQSWRNDAGLTLKQLEGVYLASSLEVEEVAAADSEEATDYAESSENPASSTLAH